MAVMPQPVWSMIYSASRRRHNHRCAACNRIVQHDDHVWMARIGAGTTTKVIHAFCADTHYSGDFCWYDALWAWGIEYLARLGYRDALIAKDIHPIFRAAA